MVASQARWTTVAGAPSPGTVAGQVRGSEPAGRGEAWNLRGTAPGWCASQQPPRAAPASRDSEDAGSGRFRPAAGQPCRSAKGGAPPCRSGPKAVAGSRTPPPTILGVPQASGHREGKRTLQARLPPSEWPHPPARSVWLPRLFFQAVLGHPGRSWPGLGCRPRVRRALTEPRRSGVHPPAGLPRLPGDASGRGEAARHCGRSKGVAGCLVLASFSAWSAFMLQRRAGIGRTRAHCAFATAALLGWIHRLSCSAYAPPSSGCPAQSKLSARLELGGSDLLRTRGLCRCIRRWAAGPDAHAGARRVEHACCGWRSGRGRSTLPSCGACR